MFASRGTRFVLGDASKNAMNDGSNAAERQSSDSASLRAGARHHNRAATTRAVCFYRFWLWTHISRIAYKTHLHSMK